MEKNDSLLSKENEEFLHDYLREFDLVDYKINTTSATEAGDNYLGIIVRAKIETEKLVLHWIIKIAMKQESFRQMLNVPVLYQREAYIYSKVLKVFEELQEERGVLRPFKSYPKYYTHSADLSNECVIMEDLQVKGYKTHDRLKPFDFNHVVMVLREFGRFHALSFALRDQKPSLFEEISKNCQETFWCLPTMFSDEVIEVNEGKIRLIDEALDSVSQKHICDTFNKMKRNFNYIGKNSTQANRAGKYGVINHGDCWTNNFLFQYSAVNNLERPTNLAIIDWQLSRVGSPVLDIVHFIYTCTDKKLRDEHYAFLIEEYYDSFSWFLKKLGSDPDKLFPYSVYQDHLNQFSIFGFHMALQYLYTSLSPKDEAPDTANITSMIDVVKTFNYKSKNENKFVTRIIEIIEDFEKLGYNLEV